MQVIKHPGIHYIDTSVRICYIIIILFLKGSMLFIKRNLLQDLSLSITISDIFYRYKWKHENLVHSFKLGKNSKFMMNTPPSVPV